MKSKRQQMSPGGWREIRNAGEDYLQLKKSFVIIVTRLKNTDSKTYKAMYAWCQENVEGSWGPGHLPEYDYCITWRFWREHEAKLFQTKFKRFFKEKQLLSY